jgi:WD40 repeat protein
MSDYSSSSGGVPEPDQIVTQQDFGQAPNGHVYSVAFSHSGQVVAAGSADGTVRLWDTSAAQAASAVCANEGQPLSRSAWETSVPGITYRAPCS